MKFSKSLLKSSNEEHFQPELLAEPISVLIKSGRNWLQTASKHHRKRKAASSYNLSCSH